MAVRLYSGTARTVDDVYEGRPGFEVVEVDAPDASLLRGYREIATGKLFSLGTAVCSPARLAALAAARADIEASDAQFANFKASIVDLGLKIKNNTATAAEQRTYMVKLGRAVLGLMSD